MADIQRYEVGDYRDRPGGWMEAAPWGEFVKYEDHLKALSGHDNLVSAIEGEVGRLREEAKEKRAGCNLTSDDRIEHRLTAAAYALEHAADSLSSILDEGAGQ